jgi:hypothetical protein
LFYTGTNIINISVVDYYSLNVDSTYRFAKIAWSPTAGFVITTTKQNTQQIDFLKSPDGINWTVSLQTNTMHTNYFMEWNSYFKAFIGLSIIDGNPNIVFSTNAENWYFYEMDTIYDSLSSSSDILGFISTNEINVWFAKFLVQLQSKTIVLNTKLSNGQIWIYNKQNTYDENLYVYFNNVYNIIDSNYKESSIFKIDKLDGVYTTENTQTNSYIYFLDRAINTRIPYNLYFEVLGSTIDNFNGLNEPFKRDQDKCYQITLQELIVPNKKIKTYIGNQISFYPYIYVVLKNEKTNVYSAYSMITNNNKMNQATFKISVSQFTSDPSRLPFIRLMSPATINSVFNLHKPFRFTIYLPNGEVFDLTESDNIFPDQSNPLLQVSATFRFNEKNKL